jgi:putative membrane protein insertion efficiency factor
MKYVLVFLITLYQKLLSPWLPPSCRYTPSCSQYAKEALLKHGLFRGLLLAAKRLARCHPFHAGGYDPVP